VGQYIKKTAEKFRSVCKEMDCFDFEGYIRDFYPTQKSKLLTDKARKAWLQKYTKVMIDVDPATNTDCIYHDPDEHEKKAIVGVKDASTKEKINRLPSSSDRDCAA
jgi:hypothetical protein